MRGVRSFAAVLLAAAVSAAPLAAFTLEPMSTLLSPSGQGSVATFRIRNDGAERIAIRVSVLSRSLGPEGAEENGPAGDLFTVYPARLLIEPGIASSVKVQWKGPPDLDAERCFRLVAEQLPVQDKGDDAGSGIRILFRYIASLYVGERSFQPDLAAGVKGAVDGGAKGFLVEIANRGSRHVIALQVGLRLADPDGGAEITLAGKALGALDGANYLPGGVRRLFIPDADAVVGKLYNAAIDYKGEY